VRPEDSLAMPETESPEAKTGTMQFVAFRRRSVPSEDRTATRHEVLLAPEGLVVGRGAQGPSVANFEARPGSIDGFASLEAASLAEALVDVRHRLGDSDGEWEVREAGCPGGMPGVESRAAEPARGRRFALLMRSEALERGFVPGPELLAPMERRNAEAAANGVLIAGEGLRTSAKGARVRRAAGSVSFHDGPFAETKELVAGYWLIEVPSIDDAVAWVGVYPYPVDDARVEIRPQAPRTPGRTAERT
jgi:hypothetical protein